MASFVSRLAPWYLAGFIAKPAVNLAAIYKFQGSMLVLDSIYLVLILSAFYFTVSLELTELWCVLLLGLVGTLVKVAAIGVSMFYLDKKLAR